MIFTATDGSRIHCQSDCVQEARGSFLVVHGLGEHGGRYDEFAARLNTLGFDVHRLDLRGHGRSEGIMGHAPSFSQYHQDIEAWWEFLRTGDYLKPGIPLILLGHSLGGLIAADLILHHRGAMVRALDGLVLSSPALGISTLYKALGPFLDMSLPGFFERVHFSSGINPAYLSHDEEVVKTYESDPLVHNKITIGLFRGILDRIQKVQKTKSTLPLNVLFLVAEADKIVDAGATMKFAKSIRAKQKEIRTFHDFYHEVFNEKDRDDVYQALLNWLDKWVPHRKKTKQSSSKSSGEKASAKGTSHSPPAKRAGTTSI